jgi:N6-adenosine-specific RNA methylase IME4
MDPDTCLRELQDLLTYVPYDRAAREEANERVDSLRRWLFDGGFEPAWDRCPEAGHVVRSGGFFLVG